MRKFLFTLSALALSFGLPIFTARAQTTSGGTSQAAAGVTMTVSLSGYQFTPLIGNLVSPPVTSNTVISVPPFEPAPQGFTASAAVRNHTGQDIAFTLGVTGTPGGDFRFQVYNSSGTLVWDSLGNIAIPTIVRLDNLKPGHALHGTTLVPLFINGVPLPAGNYTVDVTLFGTPEFSATTSFVVNNAIVIN